MNKVFRFSLLALISLLGGLVMLSTDVSAGLEHSAAPDFTLKSTDGRNFRLSEYRGDVVLINFWASWCGPCRQEMPLLSDMHERYKSLGFTVLGINVEEDSSDARRLLGKMPVSFPVLLDNTSSVSKKYDVAAMPSTVIVDRDGNMRYLHKGYKPGLEELYLQQVRKLITE